LIYDNFSRREALQALYGQPDFPADFFTMLLATLSPVCLLVTYSTICSGIHVLDLPLHATIVCEKACHLLTPSTDVIVKTLNDHEKSAVLAVSITLP
jgi:hypothetical protein